MTDLSRLFVENLLLLSYLDFLPLQEHQVGNLQVLMSLKSYDDLTFWFIIFHHFIYIV